MLDHARGDRTSVRKPTFADVGYALRFRDASTRLLLFGCKVKERLPSDYHQLGMNEHVRLSELKRTERIVIHLQRDGDLSRNGLSRGRLSCDSV
jgi:hypothetical protein